jgi:capsular exopolysaccharide synthesis family protein
MNSRVDVLERTEADQAVAGEKNAQIGLTAPAALNGHGRNRAVNDEALRLVHQVFLPQIELSPRVVAFAGMDHGNGCSQICASVAEILAGDALRSVCLVEANFRSPDVSGSFGERNDCGLADALTRRAPIRTFLSPTHASRNLWLLPCGTLPPDSASLFTSGSLGERIAELRAEFDFVVIDTPPLMQYADAIALGQLADGIILIVEAGVTRRDETARAVASLRASKVPVLAAVLNKRTSPIPERLYKRL